MPNKQGDLSSIKTRQRNCIICVCVCARARARMNIPHTGMKIPAIRTSSLRNKSRQSNLICWRSGLVPQVNSIRGQVELDTNRWLSPTLTNRESSKGKACLLWRIRTGSERANQTKTGNRCTLLRSFSRTCDPMQWIYKDKFQFSAYNLYFKWLIHDGFLMFINLENIMKFCQVGTYSLTSIITTFNPKPPTGGMYLI
jgi:hypothetical protein